MAKLIMKFNNNLKHYEGKFMQKTFIYDLPLRVFHFLFAILFVATFSITKITENDTWSFALHMFFGCSMLTLVVLRIFWGFFGSQFSLFKSLVLDPSELIEYLKSAIKTKTKIYQGHNPASSYLLVIMLILTICICGTGLLTVLKVNKHLVEDIHGLLANLFLALSLAHLAGIFLHTKKHRDPIALSIITGKKLQTSSTISPPINSYPFIAIIFIAATFTTFFFLFNHFDKNEGVLKIGTVKLELIEKE